MAAPASTSEGKCFCPSTRAHATELARAILDAFKVRRSPLFIRMASRFRLASAAPENAAVEWPEGKLLSLLSSGLSRLDQSFKAMVISMLAPKATSSTLLPRSLAPAHDQPASPLGVI